MIDELLEAITKKRDKYARSRTVIQHGPDVWTEKRALWPRKTIYGKRIWPGQCMVKYTHTELCYKESKEQFRSGSMYSAWFYLYFTQEEYTMLKLHDSFK